MVSSNSRTFKKQDEKQKKFSEKVYHNIGIVAQDYDYENDPIAKQFIFKAIDYYSKHLEKAKSYER